ncbi:DUF3693 domain-containing protein [Xylella fastidiosa]|uniref:DUF3693 domain-containing protein n=1 Tax=Xylella fastidiosa TaxID=2371 RepID=UPI001F1B907F|nr:DUF3693 domain-containing protein [Xylella fastidiosa]UIT48327.1 DUF3693 domain-containing protein [Xylella fastidiosa subsp. multiplex]
MKAKKILLDKAISMCFPANGETLGKKIGVSRSAVSKWRKGGVITEKHAAELAAIAKLNGEIVIKVLEEQAETRAQRQVWQSILNLINATANGATTDPANEPMKLVGRAGIEPATSGLKVRASGKE